MMLGVQRSGISIAARILQNNGLIRYKHGHVTVIDPDGLGSVACECHRTLNSRLDQLFPSK
jgi:hypothetical protein